MTQQTARRREAKTTSVLTNQQKTKIQKFGPKNSNRQIPKISQKEKMTKRHKNRNEIRVKNFPPHNHTGQKLII
jgi:hypothetical protein